jgi:sugar lactone lactonase YvrE
MKKLLTVSCVLALNVVMGCGGAPAVSDTPEDVPPASVAPAKAEAPAETPPAPTVATPVVTYATGFSTPESVFYDAEEDVYLVSNIQGSPTAADKNGYISKLSPDGTVIAEKWIDGTQKGVTLSAPKGMGVVDGKLYVADIDFVRVFDRATGKPVKSIKVFGAKFLNDIAVGADGSVYVSDSGLKITDKGFEPTGTDAVWKVSLKAAAERVTAKKADLGRPNGLLATAGGIWVSTFAAAELFRLGDKGAKADVVTLPAGGLDGIVAAADGTIYVTSWEAKAIYKGKAGAVFEPALPGVTLESPADIGYDSKRNRLLVPLFMGNQVLVFAL